MCDGSEWRCKSHFKASHLESVILLVWLQSFTLACVCVRYRLLKIAVSRCTRTVQTHVHLFIFMDHIPSDCWLIIIPKTCMLLMLWAGLCMRVSLKGKMLCFCFFLYCQQFFVFFSLQSSGYHGVFVVLVSDSCIESFFVFVLVRCL